MKKTRFTKIISLLLSALFILGAFAGLTAFAEEENTEVEDTVVTPTVSIKYKNVAYEGAVKLVFYVESANLADGQSVKLVLSDKAFSDVVIDDKTAVYAPKGKLTVAGAEYDAFVSEEIAPAALRKSLYAAAVVVDADNNVVSRSEVLEYSVFEYCMDRFDADATADQQALYKALLDFGAAVQTVLGYNNETVSELGGWADAYYAVKLDKVKDGEVFATTKYYYTEEELYTSCTVITDRFVQVGGEYARFDSATAVNKGFNVTSSGSAVTFAPRGLVGFDTVLCKYNGGGTFANFEVGKKPVFDGMDFGAAAAAAPNKDADGDGVADGKYVVAKSETLVDENGNEYENVYLNFAKEEDGSSFNWKFEKDAEVGKTKYVISFDFRWNFADNFRHDGSRTVLYYCDIGSSNNNTSWLGNGDASADGKTLTMNGATFKSGEWHNIEYEFVLDETTNKYNISVYIDGVKAKNEALEKNQGEEIFFKWEIRYGNTTSGTGTGKCDVNFDVDNLYYSAS